MPKPSDRIKEIYAQLITNHSTPKWVDLSHDAIIAYLDECHEQAQKKEPCGSFSIDFQDNNKRTDCPYSRPCPVHHRKKKTETTTFQNSKESDAFVFSRESLEAMGKTINDSFPGKGEPMKLRPDAFEDMRMKVNVDLDEMEPALCQVPTKLERTGHFADVEICNRPLPCEVHSKKEERSKDFCYKPVKSDCGLWECGKKIPCPDHPQPPKTEKPEKKWKKGEEVYCIETGPDDIEITHRPDAGYGNNHPLSFRTYHEAENAQKLVRNLLKSLV